MHVLSSSFDSINSVLHSFATLYLLYVLKQWEVNLFMIILFRPIKMTNDVYIIHNLLVYYIYVLFVILFCRIGEGSVLNGLWSVVRVHLQPKRNEWYFFTPNTEDSVSSSTWLQLHSAGDKINKIRTFKAIKKWWETTASTKKCQSFWGSNILFEINSCFACGNACFLVLSQFYLVDLHNKS